MIAPGVQYFLFSVGYIYLDRKIRLTLRACISLLLFSHPVVQLSPTRPYRKNERFIIPYLG